MNDLIAVQMNAVTLFAGEELDPLLQKIAAEARSFVPDTSTKKGRDAIASLAHKVAKSKTALDDIGKNLTVDWKARAKIVDVERKKLRDFLDALKAEVRKPLTEFEDAALKRIRSYHNSLAVIQHRGIASLGEIDEGRYAVEFQIGQWSVYGGVHEVKGSDPLSFAVELGEHSVRVRILDARGKPVPKASV